LSKASPGNDANDYDEVALRCNSMVRVTRYSVPVLLAGLWLSTALPLRGQQTASSQAVLKEARREAAQGHAVEAVRLFRRVHAVLSAQDALAFATALAATGDVPDAKKEIGEALVRNAKSAPLNDAFGALLAQEGHLDQALVSFKAAVAADPGYARAQYHLGVVLLSLNDPAEALAALETAAAANPDDFDVQLQLGRTFSALQQDGDALDHLHRAVALRTGGTAPQATYALALALQASGDSKSALPLFDSVLVDPRMADAVNADNSMLINDALAHVQTGDAVGALPLYTRALALGPDSVTLREDFGVAYLQQSDLNHAIEEFRAGLIMEPQSAHLHYDLGLALKLKDDLAAAVPEFKRSAQLDPTLPDPAYTLGLIAMQQGNFAEAATQLKTATTLQPQNGDAWALLGSVLKDAGDSAGAAEALKKAIALEPMQPSLHIQLAALESEAGDKSAAAADRKVAAELSRAAISRQRASFALKSGRTLLGENKIPEAIVQLDTAVQADPTLPEAHTLLADAYAREGKSAEAGQERQKAEALTRTGTHP
jgi:tetratricopeptide (TPR) repeat protein